VFFIVFFILGSIWGSFSNVCIHRLPKDQGVILSRSLCPKCKNTIRWYDNIPLISYLLLKAKCRNCNYNISFRYFVVELLSAFLFVIIYYFYGITITTLLLIILSIFFTIIFFIDLKHYIIPDQLTYPLMVIGFIKSFFPSLNQIIFPNFINSLIGGIFGYLIIWSIIFFYKQFRKKEGMGLGDAKLLAAIGFWFGWFSVPFIILISSVVALLIVLPSVLNKTKKMSSQIPFGPYIIIGCLVYIVLINLEIIKLF
tara:strand:+ start:529 stop:1293 length:765 start_codon:yes stop_codon:yes gene_type:complete